MEKAPRSGHEPVERAHLGGEPGAGRPADSCYDGRRMARRLLCVVLASASVASAQDRSEVQAAVRGLTSGDADVRYRSIVRFFLEEDLPLAKHRFAIAKLLGDPDSEIRELAGFALDRLGKEAVGLFISALKEKNPLARAEAARALGRVGRPAVPDLLRMMALPRREYRAAAAQALGHLSKDVRPDALATLSSALADEDAVVRCAAARALAAYLEDPATVLPLLSRLLADSDLEVARSAGASISCFESEALPSFEAAIALDGPHVGSGLASAARGLKARGVPILAKALDGPQQARACEAASATGAWALPLLGRLDEIATDAARKAAREIRRSGDLASDCSAAEALLPSDPEHALPDLEEARYGGNAHATTVLGRHLLRQDALAGKALLLEAAAAGDAPAMEALGDYYRESERHSSDDEALQWYRAAADKGSARGLVGVADLLGERRRDDDLEVMALYEQAAKLGSTDAMRRLARMWTMGHHAPGVIRSSPWEGREWMRKAAIRGDREAMSELGLFYAADMRPAEDYAWTALALEGAEKSSPRQDALLRDRAKQQYSALSKAQRAEAAEIMAALREEMKQYQK